MSIDSLTQLPEEYYCQYCGGAGNFIQYYDAGFGNTICEECLCEECHGYGLTLTGRIMLDIEFPPKEETPKL